MIQLTHQPDSNILHVELSGKLHDEDYQQFVPAVDAAIKSHGKLRMLVRFHEFHGWDTHALWDDIKFATSHCTAIERIALVGERTWEAWMAKICRPFTTAKIEYFDASGLAEAEKWLRA